MTQTAFVSDSIVFKTAELTEDQSQHRQLLRRKLQLDEPLKQRQALRLGDGIHCELYESDDSTSPVIVFFPGIGTYCELYAQLLQAISAKGFSVVGVDLRGHGYSVGQRGSVTVEQVIADYELVISALETKFSGPIGVYGFSIGATLAASIAVCDSRVKALMGSTLLLPDIALDSIHRIGWNWISMSSFWMPNYKVPLQQFLDFESLVAHTNAANEIKSDPLLVDAYPLKTLSSLFNTPTGLLMCERELPIAILHGDRDEVLPLEYSKKVRAQCPSIDLVVAKGQGHMLPWDDFELNAKEVAHWFHQTMG